MKVESFICALAVDGCKRKAKSARTKKDSVLHGFLSEGSDLAQRLSAQDVKRGDALNEIARCHVYGGPQ